MVQPHSPPPLTMFQHAVGLMLKFPAKMYFKATGSFDPHCGPLTGLKTLSILMATAKRQISFN